MQFIQNVSLIDAIKGNHKNPGENSMLIRIFDPCTGVNPVKHQFKEIHEFVFCDAEGYEDLPEECFFSEYQAKQITALLKHALKNEMNVIVHCHMGLCRSGAVTEVGVMMGFADTGIHRQPNMRVKHFLMKELGWYYE